ERGRGRPRSDPPGREHLAHATAADLPLDLEVADLLARSQGRHLGHADAGDGLEPAPGLGAHRHRLALARTGQRGRVVAQELAVASLRTAAGRIRAVDRRHGGRLSRTTRKVPARTTMAPASDPQKRVSRIARRCARGSVAGWSTIDANATPTRFSAS